MSEAARPGRLDGWKAIGAYLGKNERTVQLWAKDLGLPVHRVHGRMTGSVYADRAELDAWVGLNPKPPVDLAIPSDQHTRLPAASRPPSLPVETPGIKRHAFWLTRNMAAGALLIIVVGIAVLLSVRAVLARPPVRITFARNRLLAWDERDRIAWTYDFQTDVRAAGMDRPVRFVDLDGDCRNETIVAVWRVPKSTK